MSAIGAGGCTSVAELFSPRPSTASCSTLLRRSRKSY